MNRTEQTTPAAPATVPDVLRAAANAYRSGELTWGREYFSEPSNPLCRCAMGAISYVLDPANPDADPAFLGTDEEPDYEARRIAQAAIRVVEDELADRLGVPSAAYIDVGEWNDNDARDLNEVLDVLDAAAARAERVTA